MKEGSYAFWKTIFDGVPKAGRRLEIELHAKGLDQRMIDGALATGMPVRVSPKYWAEHVGLPYHQAAIRDLELPNEDASLDAFSALSFGSRQPHAVRLRRLPARGPPVRGLLPGVPGHAQVPAVGRPADGRGARAGVPVLRQRRCRAVRAAVLQGASRLGDRRAGAARTRTRRSRPRATGRSTSTRIACGAGCSTTRTRRPRRGDGCCARSTGTTRRAIEGRAGHGDPHPAARHDGAPAVGGAGHLQPRVLHEPVDRRSCRAIAVRRHAGAEGLRPRQPARPGDLLDARRIRRRPARRNQRSGKYTPPEVARWLDGPGRAGTTRLTRLGMATAEGRATVGARQRRQPAARRHRHRAQAGMGRFFAAKLRAGALFLVIQKTGDREALVQAVRLYRQARDAWAPDGRGTGDGVRARHHLRPASPPARPLARTAWPRWTRTSPDGGASLRRAPRLRGRLTRVREAIDEILRGRHRDRLDGRPRAAATFVPGAPLELALEVRWPSGLVPGNWTCPALAAVLHYRHVEPGRAVPEGRHDGAGRRVPRGHPRELHDSRRSRCRYLLRGPRCGRAVRHALRQVTAEPLAPALPGFDDRPRRTSRTTWFADERPQRAGRGQRLPASQPPDPYAGTDSSRQRGAPRADPIEGRRAAGSRQGAGFGRALMRRVGTGGRRSRSSAKCGPRPQAARRETRSPSSVRTAASPRVARDARSSAGSTR